MMTYSTRHVCALFDISTETVRTWSEEFSKYLSPAANPGRGRHRSFTYEDLRVFALVSQMKNGGAVFDDIHASLSNGQRGEVGDIPEGELRALAAVDKRHQASLAVDLLQAQLAQVSQAKEELERELQPLREEAIKLRAQLELSDRMSKERIAELKGELAARDAQLLDLATKLARLEERLSARE